jgi:hypothetical protein
MALHDQQLRSEHFYLLGNKERAPMRGETGSSTSPSLSPSGVKFVRSRFAHSAQRRRGRRGRPDSAPRRSPILEVALREAWAEHRAILQWIAAQAPDARTRRRAERILKEQKPWWM